MKIWRPFFIAFVLISMYGCSDRAEPLEGDSLTPVQLPVPGSSMLPICFQGRIIQ